MISIAIADNHPLMRQGIKDTIRSFTGFNVSVEASSGVELLDLLRVAREPPDICILDISMPLMNGYEALKEMKKEWPSIKVLMFSVFYTEFSIYQCIYNGANGCLEKSSDPKRLLQALSSIYYSDYYYSEEVAKKLFEMHNKRDKLIPNITDREMEFLCHSCSEMSYKEISRLMGISVRTIEAFRDALFAKFNIKSRAGLVLFALRNGIVPLKTQRNTNSYI